MRNSSLPSIKPIFQTIVDSVHGNCTQACMSTITGIPLEEFPESHHPADLADFLTSHGWHMLITEGQMEFWIDYTMPNVPIMMSVPSQKYEGNRHVIVVAFDGNHNLQQIHDPNPNNKPYDLSLPVSDQWYLLIPHGTMPNVKIEEFKNDNSDKFVMKGWMLDNKK